MISHPPERAAAVLHRGRRRSVARQTILDIDDRPTERQIREELENIALFLPVNPTASVKQHKRRIRYASVLGQIQIQLQLSVIRNRVCDVRQYVVISRR